MEINTMKRISKTKVKQNNFTLVELLLVLVILATLAAVVIPKFSGRSEQAKVAAAKTDISNLETALDAFEVDNEHYPVGKDGLQELFSQPADAENWKGPYLKKQISTDPWKNNYIYECPGQHNTRGYDLISTGPDGERGTDDDITNY